MVKVYDVGGVSDEKLIKPKAKTRAPVAPPLTPAEQRHVAARLTAAHAAMALWRACRHSVCRRRRRCCGPVDRCGALCSPRAWACVHEILDAIRAGHAPRRAARVAVRRARPERLHYVFGFGDPPEFTHEKIADGKWREVGEGPPLQLTLQLRRLRAGSARWLRAMGHRALVSRPSERSER
jgi:hypothetical protein